MSLMYIFKLLGYCKDNKKYGKLSQNQNWIEMYLKLNGVYLELLKKYNQFQASPGYAFV